MITAKIGEETINCYDGKYDRDTLKKWSKKKIIKCPACGEDYTYNHGRLVQPYFKHINAECSLYGEPETEEHMNGKRDLYEWVKSQNGVTEAKLEGWLPNTKQRPDVMFKYNGNQYVIEYQCSPIATEYYERHELYQAAGIKDIWICGTKNYLQIYHEGDGKKRFNILEKECGLYYNSDTKVFLSLDNRNMPCVEKTFCTKMQDDGELKRYMYNDKSSYNMFGITSAVFYNDEIYFSEERKKLIQDCFSLYYSDIFNQVNEIINHSELKHIYFNNIELKDEYIYIDVVSKEINEKIDSIKIRMNKDKNIFYLENYGYQVDDLNKYVTDCFKREENNYKNNLIRYKKNKFHNDLYNYFLNISTNKNVSKVQSNDYYDYGYKFYIRETYYGIFIKSWSIDICIVDEHDRWKTLYSVKIKEKDLQYYDNLYNSPNMELMFKGTENIINQAKSGCCNKWILNIQDYLTNLETKINTSKNKMWNISFYSNKNDFNIIVELELKLDLHNFEEDKIIRKFLLTEEMSEDSIKEKIVSNMRNIINNKYVCKSTNEYLRILSKKETQDGIR